MPAAAPTHARHVAWPLARRPPAPDGAVADAARDSVAERLARLGRAVHRWLEWAARDRAADRQALARHAARAFGVEDAAEVLQVGSTIIDSPQCRRFFAENPQIEPVVVYDTAGSVRDLLQGGMASAAAIGSRLAADLYGGQVLREAIEDDPRNYTRFLLLSRETATTAAPSKTSITFVLRNEPGALHKALGMFASRGVDLAKIESRPVRGRPFEYLFYVDFFGEPFTDPGRKALRALGRRAGFLRVLGTYPSGRLDWVGTDAPLFPAPGSTRE